MEIEISLLCKLNILSFTFIANIYRSLRAPHFRHFIRLLPVDVVYSRETVLPDSIIDSSGSLICPPKTLYRCCVTNALNNARNQAITGTNAIERIGPSNLFANPSTTFVGPWRIWIKISNSRICAAVNRFPGHLYDKQLELQWRFECRLGLALEKFAPVRLRDEWGNYGR